MVDAGCAHAWFFLSFSCCDCCSPFLQVDSVSICVPAALGSQDTTTLNVSRSLLTKVELVGGGSRSPVVQELAAKAFGVGASELSYMLDLAMSLSQGAASALVESDEATNDEAAVEANGNNCSAQENLLVDIEKAWVTHDIAARRQHEQRESLDRFISRMRVAIGESASANEGERLDGAQIEPLLAEVSQ